MTADSSPPSKADRRRQLLLAALGGVLYVLSFPGVDQFYLAFIAFVPTLIAARGASVRRAVWLGAVTGFVSHLGGYYWVVHLLREFAYLPVPAAVLGWLLVCVGQGASFGVGVGLARWLNLRTGWPWAVTLAVGLTAMDFLYPLLFPSFIANTMGGWLPMMQTADLWGVLGVTALVGGINGAFADVWMARKDGRPLPIPVMATTGLLWAGALLYGYVQISRFDAKAAQAETIRVGLVQSNMGGAANHQQRAEAVRRHVRATRDLHAQGVDLVVWPEGALSKVIDPDRSNVVQSVLQGTPQALLFGATRVDVDRHGERLPHNSAFISDETGRVLGYYDKTKLLAFGEYIPGGDWFPQIYKLLPYSSHFGRGKTTAPLVYDGWKFGTYICYEDIIPRFVRQVMAPHDGERPHVMVNITNDSWYGDTTEPPIHLSLAKFRSVEHRRALVRSTNTGISALVDPSGRVVKQTGTYTEETLVGDVPRMSGETVYQHVGDLVGYVSLGLLALGGWLGRRRTRAS